MEIESTKIIHDKQAGFWGIEGARASTFTVFRITLNGKTVYDAIRTNYDTDTEEVLNKRAEQMLSLCYTWIQHRMIEATQLLKEK